MKRPGASSSLQLLHSQTCGGGEGKGETLKGQIQLSLLLLGWLRKEQYPAPWRQAAEAISSPEQGREQVSPSSSRFQGHEDCSRTPTNSIQCSSTGSRALHIHLCSLAIRDSRSMYRPLPNLSATGLGHSVLIPLSSQGCFNALYSSIAKQHLRAGRRLGQEGNHPPPQICLHHFETSFLPGGKGKLLLPTGQGCSSVCCFQPHAGHQGLQGGGQPNNPHSPLAHYFIFRDGAHLAFGCYSSTLLLWLAHINPDHHLIQSNRKPLLSVTTLGSASFQPPSDFSVFPGSTISNALNTWSQCWGKGAAPQCYRGALSQVFNISSMPAAPALSKDPDKTVSSVPCPARPAFLGCRDQDTPNSTAFGLTADP